MAFTNSYRLERVYFEKLKSSIDILKSFLDSETDEKARALIENGIDDNGAILLLYRNLGEAWAELADLIKKAENKIDDVKAQADAYHDELNERIDEVNNYIMAIIRELEQRVSALESRVTSLETRMTAAENAITEIRGIITTIQTAIADHETRIAALEECCEEVQDTISTLETAVEGKQDQLTAGSGIAIDPQTNVISNTAQGVDLYASKSSGTRSNTFNRVAGETGANNVVGNDSNAFGSGNRVETNYSIAAGASNTVQSPGNYSFALGNNNTVKATASGAFGRGNQVNANDSVAFGNGNTINTGNNSSVFGASNTIGGAATARIHISGTSNTADGGAKDTNIEGHSNTIHGGEYNHVEGFENIVNGGHYSHVEGYENICGTNYTHVGGTYCIDHSNEGEFNRYLEIIGNGDITQRSDARILDTDGNETLSGYIYPLNNIRLKSPNGTIFEVGVDDSGVLTVTQV